ncbi:tetratricopeptide repeat protein [Bradyrhizobium sp. Arg62]|uniref:tetratricopeptide repeat protein n=1 Tax=Bradyrhizobium TaxID=374 RepID=UPI001E2A191A|nr:MULTISPECIES: tetratricopeptide repeat protein [Bradyrhizobium]MCC8939658.1 tetratricopeptide repeat protein [Bradyrhizobium ivorense]MCC8949262.1 tetratricopeptide repeat protein [Bradyrhizobium brasilense]
MLSTGMPAPTRQEKVRTAQEFISAGRLEEAEALLEEVATTSDPDTLNARATLALARRRIEFAFDMLSEAATIYPEHAGLTTNLGIAHGLLGRAEAAVICLERAAALAPRSEEIKLALAQALLSRGEVAEARAMTEIVVHHEPMNARALLQLGALEFALGHSSAAEAALLRALEIAPDDPDALGNLSVLKLERGRLDEALSLAARAHLRAPLDTAGLLHLAYCHAASGLWSQAEATCKKLLAYAPAHVGAREILARVTIAKGEEDRGIAQLTEFVRARKSDPTAALALARVLQLVGRLDESLTLVGHVVHTRPENDAAKSLQTTLELTLGRFPTPEPSASAPVRRIVVPPTMGALEFIALARLLRRLPSLQDVHVVAHPSYQALLANLAERVILDEPRPAISAMPLQSLLRVLPTDARNIADGIPYLRPEAELFAKWRDALAAFARPLVGIVWEGGALGLSMEQVAAAIPNSVTPVSLMSGAQRHDMKRWSRPIDAGVHIESPAEMIAAIANLDAVVGPDSFAVHIAGALGVCGVVFVPRGYPWYWAQAGGKPLWYPSFEVVVQERFGHWSGAIDEGRRHLETLLRKQPID